MNNIYIISFINVIIILPIFILKNQVERIFNIFHELVQNCSMWHILGM